MDKLNKYYSQNGEDYILCNFFNFKQNGYFIDVGAFDGVHLSNSYCFEQLGWKGICIEPQSLYHKHCKDSRPLTTCIHAACVDNDNIKELTIDTDSTGLFSGVNLSTEQKNINEHYSTIKKEIITTKEEVVPATTLDALLKKHLPNKDKIDFISIDVEGFEINVLKGLDLSKYAPRILLIETNTQEEQTDISSYLEQHGYMFARKVGPNSFFVKSQKDINKLNNIEITCNIEKQMHPLGREFTQQAYLDGKIIYKEKNGASMLNNYESLEKLIRKKR